MKLKFRARPVYLRKEDRIKTHFLTCYVALMVYRILEKKLEEKYTCTSIIETLRAMMMFRPGEKLGYIPAYTRTDLTDALNDTFRFMTDYKIITDVNMKQVIRMTKDKPGKAGEQAPYRQTYKVPPLERESHRHNINYVIS